MAGELRVFDRAGVDQDGVTVFADPQRRMDEPIMPVAVTGTVVRKVVPIAAGATVSLWAWASDADNWQYLRIIASGAVSISVKADAPTSASDNTPAGTKVAWHTKDLSCFAPETFQLMTIPVHATPATLVGSAFGSGTTSGRIYEIKCKNSGTEAVEVEVLIVL